MNNKPNQPLKYRRILLKLSGEALIGEEQFGIDAAMLAKMAKDIAELVHLGVEVGVVIGGGNIFRGKKLVQAGVERVTADQMSMLATVMNALAMRDALEQIDVPVCIMSAMAISGIGNAYDRTQAITDLHHKKVVLFAAGIGHPYFTTDTAACLRAIEVHAEIVLKATKVDGIYSEDPVKNPQALRYDYLSYQQVLSKGLAVMDLTAICLCQDQQMPIQVFDMTEQNVLRRIVFGEQVGTFVGAKHD